MNDHLKLELRKIDDLVGAQKYPNALHRIDELIAQFPTEASIWRKRGYINSHQGATEAAIADVSKAIAICALEPDYFYTRGIMFFQAGKYGEAILDFTKVIELCDYHRSDYYREGAYFFRADAFVRLREFEKAKADCRHVKDGMRTWTDQLRTKEEILKECGS